MQPYALDLRSHILSIPNYPKPGIVFRDVTTLFADAAAFRLAIDGLIEPFAKGEVDLVAGIEARGFIIGGAMADRLGAGFVPIRKKGKLPRETVSVSYALEYGSDEIEMHRDAVAAEQRVLLVDDLIATGGTAKAAVTLLRRLGADIVGASVIVDLPDLGGAARLEELGLTVRSLVTFDGH
ncbi:MAG: adenine phosphoribosyltransferase [Rhizobiaceae bacterium]|nr:adenine phosphoribosyltransferase [Rhizobiaceae bacterium]